MGDVLPLRRAQAVAHRAAFLGQVLEKNGVAPGRRVSAEQRHQAPALHRRRHGQPRQFQNRWREVDVRRQPLLHPPHPRGRRARIHDDERYAHGILVQIELRREPMFAVVVAVVRGEDYHGVFLQLQPAKLRENPADGPVDSGDQPISVQNVTLAAGRIGEEGEPMVTRIPGRLRIGRGQPDKFRETHGGRHGESHVPVEIAQLRVRLQRVVRRKETDGEAKGRRRAGALLQKLHRLVALDAGQVRPVLALGKVVSLARVTLEHGEVRRREPAGLTLDDDAKLADEPRAIPGLAQSHRITLRPSLRREGPVVKIATVASLDAPGEGARPAGHADGAGDEKIPKSHPPLRQRIEVGRLDDRIAAAAEVVVTLVVGQEDEEVGAGILPWPRNRP